jgi:ABC-type sugar transport system substrate-binding protein
MKHSLAVLLAILLLAGLFGCGTGGNSSQAAPAADPASAAAPASTADPASVADPASSTAQVDAVTDRNGDGKITIACVHRNLLGASGVNFRASYYYAAELAGAEIMFFDGNQDVQAQCDYIEDCIASDAADAFIVWACDADGIAGTVQELHDKGYPVITIDINIPADSDAFVAAGNYDMGVMSGESCVEYLTAKNGSPSGNVYVITATTQSTARDRTDGFLSVLKQYPDIKIVDTYDMPTSSVDDGLALADDLIQKNPRGTVDVYYCMNMSPMLGLISAAATGNRDDFVLVGGFDYNDSFIEEMQRGEESILYSFAAQDAFEIGKAAFELAVEAAKGSMPTTKDVSVVGELVDAEYLEEYLKKYNETQEIITRFQ